MVGGSSKKIKKNLRRNKVAAQGVSKINVGLSLLTSLELHYLFSFAFVLRMTNHFLFFFFFDKVLCPRSVMVSRNVARVCTAENAIVDAVQPQNKPARASASATFSTA